jgi:hypothetical protein
MRPRSNIQTVLFLLLVLATPSLAQTARNFFGFQRSPISTCLRDSEEFGIADVKLTSLALSTSTAPAEEYVGSGSSTSIRSVLLGPSIDFEKAWTETPGRLACFGSPQQYATNTSPPFNQPADVANNIGRDSKSSSAAVVRSHNQPHFDRSLYYRNRLEFAFDGGWLPINIPFVFDVFLGDSYNRTPLSYTLVPLVGSLRWQIDDVGGPWISRGNWDMTISGSITLIPRGPETRYFSYDMGIRRNFVPHRGKIAPYFDGRVGLGEIDAKGPLGVNFAQGQNFTFTMNLGSGVRYNVNPRYSASAGLNWMHISNLYLSQPAFSNYGINVYGPMFGIDIRLGKPRHASE